FRRLGRRTRGEPSRASPADRLRGARQAPRAGRRDRVGDAAQLRREQALVVPAAEALRALSSLHAVRGLLAAALAALAVAVLAPTGFASTGTTSTGPVFDGKGHLIKTPLVPPQPRASLTQKQALEAFERYPKVASWLSRYPHTGRSHEATYDAKTGEWTVKIWWGDAGEIAQGTVVDASGAVTEAWTGPQVAWGMARGSPGAFGGTAINN